MRIIENDRAPFMNHDLKVLLIILYPVLTSLFPCFWLAYEMRELYCSLVDRDISWRTYHVIVYYGPLWIVMISIAWIDINVRIVLNDELANLKNKSFEE